MQVHGGRRSGDGEIVSCGRWIELDIEHGVQFDHVGSHAMLMVKEIEEANARYLNRNVGSMEGRGHLELRVKLSPRILDLRYEGTARIHARWRGDFRDHSVALIVQEDKVVVGVSLNLEVG